MEAIGFYSVEGAPYEVGRQLAAIGRVAVHGTLLGTAAWRSVMARKTDDRLVPMAALVQVHQHALWEELRGLADGLGLPLADVFAWNCRGDLWAMAPDGCTTVLIPGADRRVIAHNEDGLPGLAGACNMARIAVADARPFVCLIYPGSLPGHAFALSASGLAATVNNVRPVGSALGLPRMVLSRAMLEAPDIDGAVALLHASPRAGGFHMTLGQRGDGRIVSVEFCHAAVSATEIVGPSIHCNHFLHSAFASLPQIVTASSAARQQRGKALLAAGHLPLDILRDTGDPLLPILRHAPNDPDGENTIATALVTIDGQGIRCEVFDGSSQQPRFVFEQDLKALAGAVLCR